ncbi:MAG: hypothetical protein WHS88_01680 [Anaerohalosphaeraceae bacterium]
MKSSFSCSCLSFLLLTAGISAVLSFPAAAQSAGMGGAGRGLWGDWELKIKFEDREMDALVSFGRDENGNLTGDWISFWGVAELKDIQFEDGKLRFEQISRFRGEEYRSKFSGKVEEDKLSGTLSGERGESEVTGRRLPRLPRVVGTWNLKYKVGDMDVEAKLIIKADKEGNLSGQWQSAPVESEVSDVKYERGTLSLKRKMKMGDRQMEASFEGTIDRQSGLLKGTLKSEMGDIAVEGARFGEALIGSWDLEIATDQGSYKQRLRVNPDLSGLYGTLPIEKIEFDGTKVSFKAKREFGERTFEISLDGKLADSKLTGQITTMRGTQTFEGKKIVRAMVRPGGAVSY